LVSSTARPEETVTAREAQWQVLRSRRRGRARREKMAHSRVRKPLWPSAALQIEPREAMAAPMHLRLSHVCGLRSCLHCSRLLPTQVVCIGVTLCGG
jgi:hypothetical protein